MPRRKERFPAGTYYHIINRGVNKAPIFFDDRDYQRAIDLLAYYRYDGLPMRFSYLVDLSAERQQEVWDALAQRDQHLVRLVAYCLMPNHYHLLVSGQVDQGIPLFLMRWQDSLARYVNLRHGRSGPLFQGTFRAVRVESDGQLLHLSRYIHLNPLTARLARSNDALRQYPWSSFPSYRGEGDNSFCVTDPVLQLFTSREGYESFVFERASYQQSLETIKHILLE